MQASRVGRRAPSSRAPCAEAALASMLTMARYIPRVAANQRAAKWERFPMGLLDGKTAVILGILCHCHDTLWWCRGAAACNRNSNLKP